jgi:16S rRNA (guanine966-N2)-methyltransferase
MRVVAGIARGRRLQSPGGNATRPTSDRVREATFNALGSLGAVQDATVIDLFAGSGALGIEALSRGAATATFVDHDRAAIAAVRANLDTCGFADRAEVVQAPAAQFVARSVAAGRTWDLALLDPPYDHADWPTLLSSLPAELAVVESGGEVALPDGWVELRAKRYGGTLVVIAEQAPVGSGPKGEPRD